jgi:hypoxanthine phosphoribosyltransferase
MTWPEDIDEILISEQQLAVKIGELAADIRADYASKNPVLIGILTGSFVFMAELMRRLDFDLTVDFIAVSSYEDATVSSGKVRVTKDCSHDIADRHVLIVEDIIDTGFTLAHICKMLKQRKPASLQVCCLLDKPSRRRTQISPDYVGFEIPDKFVVGYGLDFAEKYRNLPYVAVLKEEAYQP